MDYRGFKLVVAKQTNWDGVQWDGSRQAREKIQEMLGPVSINEYSPGSTLFVKTDSGQKLICLGKWFLKAGREYLCLSHKEFSSKFTFEVE